MAHFWEIGAYTRQAVVAVVTCYSAACCFGELSWEKRKLDFVARSGEKEIVAIFRFANEGNTPIAITAVHSSCGCTTTELSKRNYAPGESGEIKAIFSIGERVGEQEKTIQVVTDAAPTKPDLLTLRVNIPELFICDRRMLLWKIGDKLDEQAIVFTPTNGQRIENVNVTKIEPSRATTRLESVPNSEGVRLLVRPDSTAANLTVGIFCVVTFASGQTQAVVVNALVR